MQEVKMFKATDGSIHETFEAAKQHEEALLSIAKHSAFMAALLAAGYDKELASTLSRGARLASLFESGAAIPEAKKRVRK